MSQDATPSSKIPLPTSVEIALTGRCNLRCQYCFYNNEMVGLSDLSTEEWMAFIESAEPRLREMAPIDEIVQNRQYYVSSGSLVYQGSGYHTGSSFYGAGTSWFYWVDAGTLTQIGAWRKSRSSHVGRPGLAPAGVWFAYDYGTIAVDYGPQRNEPQLVTLQPWMVKAGYYTDSKLVLPCLPPAAPVPPTPPAWVFTGGYYGVQASEDWGLYSVGDTGTQTMSGSIGWDGDWLTGDKLWPVSAKDDFESYTDESPVTSILNSGTGWSGTWVL